MSGLIRQKTPKTKKKEKKKKKKKTKKKKKKDPLPRLRGSARDGGGGIWVEALVEGREGRLQKELSGHGCREATK